MITVDDKVRYRWQGTFTVWRVNEALGMARIAKVARDGMPTFIQWAPIALLRQVKKRGRRRGKRKS